MASTFKGKKTPILEDAKEATKDATAMRETHLAGEDDPLKAPPDEEFTPGEGGLRRTPIRTTIPSRWPPMPG